MAFQWYPTLLPQLGDESRRAVASRRLPFSAKAIHWMHQKIKPIVMSIQKRRLEGYRERGEGNVQLEHSQESIDAADDKYPNHSMLAWRILGAIVGAVSFGLGGALMGFAVGGPTGAAVIGGVMSLGGAMFCAGLPHYGFWGLQMLGTALSFPFTLALDTLNVFTGGLLANIFKPKCLPLEKEITKNNADDRPRGESAIKDTEMNDCLLPGAVNRRFSLLEGLQGSAAPNANDPSSPDLTATSAVRAVRAVR